MRAGHRPRSATIAGTLTPNLGMQPDLLDAASLQRRLPFVVEVRDECESTNTALLQVAVPRKTLLACERQTAGRGRRGNRWYSDGADSLSFSLLWPFSVPAKNLSGLSLAVGVACARALSALGIEGIRLKWPNDLLYRGAKLGGILIELRPGTSHAVIGIGLNLRNADRNEAAVEQPVTDLGCAAESLPSRTTLLEALALELDAALALFEREGFAPFRSQWLSLHAHAGQAVRLVDGAIETRGVAQDVTEDGALVLATPEGERRFYAGELSLRLAA